MNLTGKQIRHLRGLGHHLDPVIRIGKEQLSENVLRSTNEALETHELIKVKLQEGCDLDRREAATALAEQTGASVVQVLGKTFLLFRRAEKEKITLPG